MSALVSFINREASEKPFEVVQENDYAVCPECKGERTLPVVVAEYVGYQTCPVCHGWGEIREVQ
jgi:DnaJ-class molecular chaperone